MRKIIQGNLTFLQKGSKYHITSADLPQELEIRKVRARQKVFLVPDGTRVIVANPSWVGVLVNQADNGFKTEAGVVALALTPEEVWTRSSKYLQGD